MKRKRILFNHRNLRESDVVPNTIRVKISTELKQGWVLGYNERSNRMLTGDSSINNVFSRFGVYKGISALRHNYRFPRKNDGIKKNIGLDRWWEFTIENNDNLIDLIDELKKLNHVEIVEPALKVEQFNTDIQNQWNLLKIDILSAWEIQRGSSDVVVAIIDGGIHGQHPGLSHCMWNDGNNNFGYNFVNDTPLIVPGNHGTHVAGIIGARKHNGQGVYGVADGVQIMNCQVFNGTRAGGFHDAFIYAADNGAAIAQNSWGYSAPDIYEQITLDAIDYFNKFGGGNVVDGGITVFAAGNTGREENIYPACYEGATAVASTNSLDVRANSSTHGDWVDISAPGVNIVSTIGSDSYGSSSGTSMAAPHVSAVAALLLSIAPHHFTKSEIIEIIKNSADNHYNQNPDFLENLGSGRLNAGAALSEVKKLLNPDDNTTTEPTTTAMPTTTVAPTMEPTTTMESTTTMEPVGKKSCLGNVFFLAAFLAALIFTAIIIP